MIQTIDTGKKIIRVFTRKDNSQARIVSEVFTYFNAPNAWYLDTFVQRRDSPLAEWVTLSNRPPLNYRNMSVDEYLKHGRPEVFKAVSIAEILLVRNIFYERMPHPEEGVQYLN